MSRLPKHAAIGHRCAARTPRFRRLCTAHVCTYIHAVAPIIPMPQKRRCELYEHFIFLQKIMQRMILDAIEWKENNFSLHIQIKSRQNTELIHAVFHLLEQSVHLDFTALRKAAHVKLHGVNIVHENPLICSAGDGMKELSPVIHLSTPVHFAPP